jgi:ABC-type Na+ efflux pump permease subunit
LIGEDIESNTFPYILTRPIPRSAWVLGKFAGYWLGVSLLLGGSMLLMFLVCTRLAEFPLDGTSIALFAKFLGALVMAVGAYGALCLLLGAVSKRPIIWGIALVFFWQRIALTLPGYVDFLTIDKYVSAIMPKVEGLPSVLEMLAESVGVGRLLVEVGPTTAFVALTGIMAAFVALTAQATRWREYSSAISADT